MNKTKSNKRANKQKERSVIGFDSEGNKVEYFFGPEYDDGCLDVIRLRHEDVLQKEWGKLSQKYMYIYFNNLLDKIGAKDGRADDDRGKHMKDLLKSIRSELGEDNLPPITEFDLGLILGKMSALNFAMGLDWNDRANHEFDFHIQWLRHDGEIGRPIVIEPAEVMNLEDLRMPEDMLGETVARG